MGAILMGAADAMATASSPSSLCRRYTCIAAIEEVVLCATEMKQNLHG
jgi:hypothetical protein